MAVLTRDMQAGSIIALAFGLAMDAFAVAVGVSVSLGRVSPRQVFRFGFHFGLFQALMPLLGWAAGNFVGDQIQAWDHWVAFGLLSVIGLKALRDSLRGGPRETQNGPDPTRGVRLVLFSVATSTDALAVGLTLGMLEVQVWYAVALIGLVTATLTVAGMVCGAWLGRRLGVRFERRVEAAGGLILIGIGAKILIENTLAW